MKYILYALYRSGSMSFSQRFFPYLQNKYKYDGFLFEYFSTLFYTTNLFTMKFNRNAELIEETISADPRDKNFILSYQFNTNGQLTMFHDFTLKEYKADHIQLKEDRFNTFKAMANNGEKYFIKLGGDHLTTPIFDYFNNEDYTFINLKRRNDISQFLSLIVVQHINKYHAYTQKDKDIIKMIPENSIRVSREKFEKYVRDKKVHEEHEISINKRIDLYYEDIYNKIDDGTVFVEDMGIEDFYEYAHGPNHSRFMPKRYNTSAGDKLNKIQNKDEVIEWFEKEKLTIDWSGI